MAASVFSMAASMVVVSWLRPLPISRTGGVSCCEPSKRGAAVVTGGSGGIGLAAARKLAAAGADCVLAYGHDTELAAAACAELQDTYGVRALSVQGDLSSDSGREATVRSIFDLVDNELDGKVSYFVHAAGYFHDELMSHHFAGACTDFEARHPPCTLRSFPSTQSVAAVVAVAAAAAMAVAAAAAAAAIAVAAVAVVVGLSRGGEFGGSSGDMVVVALVEVAGGCVRHAVCARRRRCTTSTSRSTRRRLSRSPRGAWSG